MAEGGGDETPIQIITVTEDQCGYCLESGTRRVDPRRLPCGHSFCLLCLTDDFARINAVRCPVCRTFLNADISLDQLPLAKVSSESYTDKELYCETCDDGSERMTAERHCKKCDAAFCKEHIKVHNALHPKHETITPAEWMELKPVRDSMYCERHKRYPVTTGCKRCSMICCNVCLKNENHNPCPSTRDGTSNFHDFDALQNLVYQAKHDVRDTLAALQLKKDELDKLEKELGSVMEVIEKRQSETLAALEAERDKQVSALTEAIERINKHHDEMRDKFIKRMQVIRSEADEYATIVTCIQTQLDRGLEEGRQIHQCKSDADVMRRQEALTMAANSLHNITVPVTLDVTNSLRIHYTGNNQLGEKTLELAETPLYNHLDKAGLDLKLITMRTKVPTRLAFSHEASETKLTPEWNIPCRCFAYSNDGGLVGYSFDDDNGEIRIVTTNTPPISLHTYYTDSLISQLELENQKEQLHVYVRYRSSNTSALEVHSLNQHSTTPLKVKATLTKQSLPFDVISSFARFETEVVLCESAKQPRLFVWNTQTDMRYQVLLNFDKTTIVKSINSGPNKSILCGCQSTCEKKPETWYRPPENIPPPATECFVALIDLKNGATLWKQTSKNSPQTCFTLSEGFFYKLLSTEPYKLEILDAFSGQLYSTVSLEFEDRGYLLRDFALVKVDGERKKMMLRDALNTIYVFELIYEP